MTYIGIMAIYLFIIIFIVIIKPSPDHFVDNEESYDEFTKRIKANQ